MKKIIFFILFISTIITGCGPGCPDQGEIEGMKGAAYTASLNAGIFNLKNLIMIELSVRGGNLIPSEVAERIVRQINDQTKTIQQPVMNVQNLEYVLRKPTGRLQIVLIPIDSRKVIRVEGYGEDIKNPLIVQEIKVE